MFSRQSPAKTAAQQASIVLAAASLALTGCDSRQTSFNSSNVAQETVPKTASDTKLAFIRLPDNNLMAFGSTKGLLRIFKTAEGYAERGTEFQAGVVSGSQDSSTSNEYAEISYLEALALLDGQWKTAEAAARSQGRAETNFVSADLIRMTLEPLVSPAPRGQTNAYGELFTDGPLNLAYPVYEIMHRVGQVSLGEGDFSLARQQKNRQAELTAKIDAAATEREKQIAKNELAMAQIGHGIHRGALKASVAWFNFMNEQNADHWIERFRSAHEKDFISREYSNVNSNMLERGLILLPRHAPVFIKLPDGQNLLRIGQFGEEIRFFRTATGYGVTGIKGAAHIPKAGSFGYGIERPTAFLYTELSPQEVRAYYDNDVTPVLEAVQRQASVTSFTVSPDLARRALLPRQEVLLSDLERLQREKAELEKEREILTRRLADRLKPSLPEKL